MKKEEFVKEARELFNKHGLKDVVIAATDEDKKFFGLFGADSDDSGYETFFNCLLNTGRCWQSAREKAVQILNAFEK